MADHGQLAIARLATMNISVAPAHWALARSEIGARNIDNRLAKRGTTGLIANQGRKDVPLLQKHSTGDTDRFLAFANVNAAGNLATAIKTDQFFLECAREQHPTKRF